MYLTKFDLISFMMRYIIYVFCLKRNLKMIARRGTRARTTWYEVNFLLFIFQKTSSQQELKELEMILCQC